MEKHARIPVNLSLTALLSSTITLIVSSVYIVLCIISLNYQLQCDSGTTEINGSGYYINTLYRVYFQSEICLYKIDWDGITSAHSVVILVSITFAVSICGVAAACFLITAISNVNWYRYIHSATYVYVGVYIISFVVDITFATHFGIDHSLLVNQLNGSSPGTSMNYIRDVLRLGSLLLMTITLKGFVVHLINITLVIMLLVYLADYQDKSKKGQHPIHKLGALSAYGQANNKRIDENGQAQAASDYSYIRGSHMNQGFSDSEPPGSLDRNMTTHYNSLYERSDSWLPAQSSVSTSRPFSYLEEVRRPIPVKSPTVEQQWRDWPPLPPLPVPDYSPQNSKKLKSALKSNYM